MNSLWTIQLFGGLCACRGEERFTHFKTQKTARLLAYLAYYRDQTHPRETLIELLWPEGCDPADGRNRLNTQLSLVRTLLEPAGVSRGDVLYSDHSHVRLQAGMLTSDVAEFESLLEASRRVPEGEERLALQQQALALYRGELLPGFYDGWIVQERVRLNELSVDALYKIAKYQRQAGELEAALGTVSQALARDPYHEFSCRLQMWLYIALRNPAAALKSYQELEKRYREELSAEPSAATQKLAEDIRRNLRELAEQIRQDPRAVVRVVSPPRAGEGEPVTANTGRTAEPDVVPAGVNSPPMNLPLSLTRFFGREEQTERLKQWLVGPEKRLITLTGPGGAGKTRLALEVGRSIAPSLGGRVWFVDLAALQDGRLLPFALANALKATPAPQSDPLEEVVELLRQGPSLLVLDNFEHLLKLGTISAKSERAMNGESVLLVRTLLERVPDLKCLVTSRQPLHLEGEQELSVPPLAVPPDTEPLERLSDYAGVALYVDRAKAVRAEFALTQNNAKVVAALCRRLEGMPLAIEMAAAWARLLPPSQMLEKLGSRLDMLFSRRRDLPERQQSLRATFEWSYDLLEPELQSCFALLAVFRGGFSLEAAEALCGGEALEYLSELQERSLVLEEETEEGGRYRVLESLREYGSEKLAENGERTEAQQRHAEFFLGLAEEAEPRLAGVDQVLWLRRLEAEHDNLLAALDWSMKADQGGAVGLRLCGALARFWQVRGHWKEGRAWCLAALSREGSPADVRWRAKALNGAGALALRQSDYAAAQDYHAQAQALFREIGDQSGIATALQNLGNVAAYRGDYAAAQDYHAQAQALFREIGDQSGIADALNSLGRIAPSPNDKRIYFMESLALRREIGDRVGMAVSLNNLGAIAEGEGDYVAARAYYDESLSLKREVGDKRGIATALLNLGHIAHDQGDYAAAYDFFAGSLSIRREIGDRRGIAHALHGMGSVARAQGDYGAARTCFAESLSISQEIGDKKGMSDALEGFADLATAQEQAERSVWLLGAVERLREDLGAPATPGEREQYDRVIAMLQQSLDTSAFAMSWEEGRQMTLDQVIDVALRK